MEGKDMEITIPDDTIVRLRSCMDGVANYASVMPINGQMIEFEFEDGGAGFPEYERFERMYDDHTLVLIILVNETFTEITLRNNDVKEDVVRLLDGKSSVLINAINNSYLYLSQGILYITCQDVIDLNLIKQEEDLVKILKDNGIVVSKIDIECTQRQ